MERTNEIEIFNQLNLNQFNQLHGVITRGIPLCIIRE